MVCKISNVDVQGTSTPLFGDIYTSFCWERESHIWGLPRPFSYFFLLFWKGKIILTNGNYMAVQYFRAGWKILGESIIVQCLSSSNKLIWLSNSLLLLLQQKMEILRWTRASGPFLAKRRRFGQNLLFIGQKDGVLLNDGPECFSPPEHIHNAPITILTKYLVKLFRYLLNQNGDQSG